MKALSKLILKWIGWKIQPLPSNAKKCVMIMAPHTSNMDFYIGILGFWSLGIDAKILIKKEAFKPGIGFFLKKIGGLPVDRNKKNNLTEIVTNYFESSEELIVLFTPEGTRSHNKKWKKGFYYIAKSAKVPIILGYMDFDKKIGGFFSDFAPIWDEEKDFETIKSYYKNITPKVPENFGY